MTTSLSNLIKRHEHDAFEIKTFRAQEIQSEPGFNRNKGKSGRGASPGDRISQIEREAYEKGFNQGQKDGLALGKKRLEETARRLESLIESLGRLKGELYLEAEEEILKLSMAIARKVVQRELAQDEDAVLRTIRKAVEFLNERTNVKILVNPADMRKVEEALPEIRGGKKIDKIELAEDPAIGRGGCILETGFGTINGTVEDQLAAIKEELEDELGSNGHGDAGIT